MRPKLILFGDSITEESFGDGGWGAALAHHFSRKVDVVLRGYSGYNTRWALKVAERALDGLLPPEEEGEGSSALPSGGEGGRQHHADHPLAVTVFFGANDASLPDRISAFQHIPIAEYRHNLHALISLLKKRWPSTTVLLISPPPIDEDGRLRHPFAENPSGLPERTNESAGAYAKACVAVATEADVPVVDLWSRMQRFPGWEKALLRDGLHLTADGNRIVFEEVAEKLRQHGLGPETLPADLPLLSEIDPLDPLRSFDKY